MGYQNSQIAEVAKALKARAKTEGSAVLRSTELKALFDEIKTLPANKRAQFGQEINLLKLELQKIVDSKQSTVASLKSIDVTAPFDINVPADKRPKLLPSEFGGQHPLTTEINNIVKIFARMGLEAVESRQLDDDYHMFTSLNFPEGHPARDDWDTFVTVEKDKDGKPFIAPAQTSTMQNRVLKERKYKLKENKPIAVIIPGRTFRNEDVDARHEHTFYQLEGIYVDHGINAGHLVATIKEWLNNYYNKEINIKIQPFYFPFTEPSFEFIDSCPFCEGNGCGICSHTGWIELGGCGVIHPNVLKMADIDPNEYTGFAWGFGIDRLVMLKNNIEDVRHFESGKLEFLRQFR